MDLFSGAVKNAQFLADDFLYLIAVAGPLLQNAQDNKLLNLHGMVFFDANPSESNANYREYISNFFAYIRVGLASIRV